jgi:hypothetical protein
MIKVLFDLILRINYYSLIWIKNDKETAKEDFSEYHVKQKCFIDFSPYQPFMFQTYPLMQGTVVNFQLIFFIHKHHQEVAYYGVLFKNIYNPPFVTVAENASYTFNILLE